MKNLFNLLPPEIILEILKRSHPHGIFKLISLSKLIYKLFDRHKQSFLYIKIYINHYLRESNPHILIKLNDKYLISLADLNTDSSFVFSHVFKEWIERSKKSNQNKPKGAERKKLTYTPDECSTINCELNSRWLDGFTYKNLFTYFTNEIQYFTELKIIEIASSS